MDWVTEIKTICKAHPDVHVAIVATDAIRHALWGETLSKEDITNLEKQLLLAFGDQQVSFDLLSIEQEAMYETIAAAACGGWNGITPPAGDLKIASCSMRSMRFGSAGDFTYFRSDIESFEGQRVDPIDLFYGTNQLIYNNGADGIETWRETIVKDIKVRLRYEAPPVMGAAAKKDDTRDDDDAKKDDDDAEDAKDDNDAEDANGNDDEIINFDKLSGSYVCLELFALAARKAGLKPRTWTPAVEFKALCQDFNATCPNDNLFMIGSENAYAALAWTATVQMEVMLTLTPKPQHKPRPKPEPKPKPNSGLVGPARYCLCRRRILLLGRQVGQEPLPIIWPGAPYRPRRDHPASRCGQEGGGSKEGGHSPNSCKTAGGDIQKLWCRRPATYRCPTCLCPCCRGTPAFSFQSGGQGRPASLVAATHPFQRRTERGGNTPKA